MTAEVSNEERALRASSTFHRSARACMMACRRSLLASQNFRTRPSRVWGTSLREASPVAHASSPLCVSLFDPPCSGLVEKPALQGLVDCQPADLLPSLRGATELAALPIRLIPLAIAPTESDALPPWPPPSPIPLVLFRTGGLFTRGARLAPTPLLAGSCAFSISTGRRTGFLSLELFAIR